ncbi:MAG: BamA/TamA family outer membrane protein [Sphingomonadaceae bacterium]|nr:BamA/TamA family outer membrane protein [Sphingomonadaceae bacterium]
MFPVALRHCASRLPFAAAFWALPGVAHAQPPPGAPPPSPLTSSISSSPGGELDPNSPMQALPDLGVAWPDPTAAAPAAPGAAPATGPTGKAQAPRAAIDAGVAQRYTVVLEGIDAAGGTALRARFDSVSTLVQSAGKPANVAQIDRRATEDAETLRALLVAEGFYDAEVDTKVEAQPDARIRVRLIATAGGIYHFSSVTLPGLDATAGDAPALRAAFTLKPDDPVDADKVNAAQASLKAALGERGYVFAKLDDPQIVVDHDAHAATLSLAVAPNGVKRFGHFELRGRHLFTAQHIAQIARLHPGDPLNAKRIDDLRRALIATGLVSTIQLTPIQTADPQVADLAVRLEPAPPRTVAAELGYGTGEGASLQLSWEHRNLLPPEGAVTFRGIVGTQEQALSANYRRSNFRSRDEALTGQLAIDHQKRPAYEAKTASVSAGIERQTNIIWQKKWTWSVGGQLLASDEKDVIQATGQPRDRTYFIGLVPLSLAYDGSDNLLDPTRGYRLSSHVSPSLSFQNGTFGYTIVQLDGSYYVPVSRKVVLAGRLRFGSIFGPDASRIAPSQRFYSGGGGSVRGYGYQDIGPRDIDNDPVGGKSLNEFALEARIRFGNFGVVPFFDGGNLYSSTMPRLTGLRYGTGIGVRYYTSFGPIRVDLGTPVNPQKGDTRVAVYVSLGQAF